MLPCTEERSAIIKATTWNTKCAWKLKPVWHSGFGKRHIDHSDFKISLHTHNDGDPYRTGTSCPAWCGLSALGLPPLTPWDISYFLSCWFYSFCYWILHIFLIVIKVYVHNLMEAWERGVPGPGDTGCFISVMSGNNQLSLTLLQILSSWLLINWSIDIWRSFEVTYSNKTFSCQEVVAEPVENVHLFIKAINACSAVKAWCCMIVIGLSL